MKIYQVHMRVLLRATVDNLIIGVQNPATVLPGRQTSAFDVTDAVRGVVNIGQKNMTAAGKPLLDSAEHGFKAAFEILNPGRRLLQRGSIHSLIARRSPTVIMNKVVASGRNDHYP